jgi:hypothetical protein
MAKLTESQVVEILTMLAEGVRQVDIAERFGVNRTTICNIKSGKSWSHVERVQRKPTKPLNPDPVECKHGGIHEHGTNLMYVTDVCRCAPCSDDHKAYMARRKRMIELGTYRNHLQDVEPLREHMRMLKRHGIGAVQLSRITGLAERTFWRINFGPDTGRVQARTARKILAVQPDFGESGNGTRIYSTGTRRRLQALIAMGWSHTVLSKEMGLSQGFLRLVHKQPTVRVRTAEVVAAHYDRLWNKPVPPSAMKSRALSMARARGYLSPLAWDDDEIDDPKARPKGQYRETA